MYEKVGNKPPLTPDIRVIKTRDSVIDRESMRQFPYIPRIRMGRHSRPEESQIE